MASPLRMRTHEYCSVKTIAQIWDLGATSDLAIYTLVASQEWSVWYNEFRAADYNGWRNRQKGEREANDSDRRWICKKNNF